MRKLCQLLCVITGVVFAQRIEVKDAPRLVMPGEVDSNSPAFWRDGRLNLINSTGNGPALSRGRNQYRLSEPKLSTINRQRAWPAWIEAVWVDPSGTILGWYHQEEEYACGKQRPAMPRIGAVFSYDGGQTFWDQGVILLSADPVDCSSQNGYFSGGHGDFSVVLDREQKFFYFLFTNYGGPVETQGVVIARMAFESRFHPSNAVWKYHLGSWNQPGVGGRTTPIFRSNVSWQREDTDSFWGPSIHWNTYLETFVVLMNRSCCHTGFPQEGVYASFNPDLSDPEGWRAPEKILEGVSWYPQVLGIGPEETDSTAGKRARLYVYGESRWRLVFHKSGEEIFVDPEIPDADPEEPTPEPAPAPPEPESPSPDPQQGTP